MGINDNIEKLIFILFWSKVKFSNSFLVFLCPFTSIVLIINFGWFTIVELLASNSRKPLVLARIILVPYLAISLISNSGFKAITFFDFLEIKWYSEML